MSFLGAMVVYSGILYVAFFGMVAFDAQAVVTRRAKQLGAVTFLVIVIEIARASS